MVRLYITLDEFANRQEEGIEMIFWLHRGRSFRHRASSAMGRQRLRSAGYGDETVIHASPVFPIVQNGVMGVDLDVDKTGPGSKRFYTLRFVEVDAVGLVTDDALGFTQDHLPGADPFGSELALATDDHIVSDFMPGIGCQVVSHGAAIRHVEQQPSATCEQASAFQQNVQVGVFFGAIAQGIPRIMTTSKVPAGSGVARASP